MFHAFAQSLDALGSARAYDQISLVVSDCGEKCVGLKRKEAGTGAYWCEGTGCDPR